MLVEDPMLIKIENVCAAYDKRKVLFNISLRINNNDFISIIGPNGAGKSTLLKIISGVIRPTVGRIFYLGEYIEDLNVEQRVEKGIGYLIQGGGIFPDLTVYENLLVSALKMPRDRINVSLEEIFDLFPDLKSYKFKRAGLLSGGERKILAIAMILMFRPRCLLLLDEPSSGLSPKLVKKVFDKIIEIKEKYKLTILLVEQRITEALVYSNRTYVLKEGYVVDERDSFVFLKDIGEIKKIFFGNSQ